MRKEYGREYIDKCNRTLSQYGKLIPSMKMRLQDEFKTIDTYNLGLSFDSLKRMSDVIQNTKIPFSTRGTAGNSLVMYLLGLSHYNPVEYNIPAVFFFERFRKSRVVDLNVAKNDQIRLVKGLMDKIPITEGSALNEDPCMTEIVFRSGSLEHCMIKVKYRKNRGSLSDYWRVIDLYDEDSNRNKVLIIRLYTHKDIETISALENMTEVKAPANPERYRCLFHYFDNSHSAFNVNGLGVYDSEFLRNYMLDALIPRSVLEIAKILGLSMSVGSYVENQQSYLKEGTLSLSDAIACYEDIYNYLIHQLNMSKEDAFRIVKKCTKETRNDPNFFSRANPPINIPDIYASVVTKIKYLLPAGQLFDYAWQILCLAYYKRFWPKEFYIVTEKMSMYK